MILYEQLGRRNALLRENATTDVCLIDTAPVVRNYTRPLWWGGRGGGAAAPGSQGPGIGVTGTPDGWPGDTGWPALRGPRLLQVSKLVSHTPSCPLASPSVPWKCLRDGQSPGSGRPFQKLSSLGLRTASLTGCPHVCPVLSPHSRPRRPRGLPSAPNTCSQAPILLAPQWAFAVGVPRWGLSVDPLDSCQPFLPHSCSA